MISVGEIKFVWISFFVKILDQQDPNKKKFCEQYECPYGILIFSQHFKYHLYKQYPCILTQFKVSWVFTWRF